MKRKEKTSSVSKKNLKNGQNSTTIEQSILPLSGETLCAIIKTCAESKVALLKLGDLQITFDTPIGREVMLAEDSRPLSGAEMPGNQSLQNEQYQESLQQAAEKIRTDKIEHLLLTDPLEYEKMLLNGELDKDDGDTDEPGDGG